jgi:hypothetical protein
MTEVKSRPEAWTCHIMISSSARSLRSRDVDPLSYCLSADLHYRGRVCVVHGPAILSSRELDMSSCPVIFLWPLGPDPSHLSKFCYVASRKVTSLAVLYFVEGAYEYHEWQALANSPVRPRNECFVDIGQWASPGPAYQGRSGVPGDRYGNPFIRTGYLC